MSVDLTRETVFVYMGLFESYIIICGGHNIVKDSVNIKSAAEIDVYKSFYRPHFEELISKDGR